MNTVQINDLAPMTPIDKELAADAIRLDDRMGRITEIIDECRTDLAEGKAIGFRLAELSCYTQQCASIARSIAARC